MLKLATNIKLSFKNKHQNKYTNKHVDNFEPPMIKLKLSCQDLKGDKNKETASMQYSKDKLMPP